MYLLKEHNITMNGKPINDKTAEQIFNLYKTGRYIVIETTVYEETYAYTYEREYYKHHTKGENVRKQFNAPDVHDSHRLTLEKIAQIKDEQSNRAKQRKQSIYKDMEKSARAYYKDDADGLNEALNRIQKTWDFLDGVALGNTYDI